MMMQDKKEKLSPGAKIYYIEELECDDGHGGVYEKT